jgi:peptidoglycan/LPS O-acetylase OafA/YrhL
MPNQYYHAINPILFLPCFMLGIFIYRLKNSWLAVSLKPWAGNSAVLFAFIALVLLLSQPGVWSAPNAGVSYWLKVHVFSLFFAVLVFVATYASSAFITNMVTDYLGKLSYSIYLIHAPVIVLAVKPLVPNLTLLSGGDPNLMFLLCSFATLAITLPLAHLAYEFIEKPGIAMGVKVARRL